MLAYVTVTAASLVQATIQALRSKQLVQPKVSSHLCTMMMIELLCPTMHEHMTVAGPPCLYCFVESQV